ncbi:MAG: flavodoxin [Limosilactobacillus pontis]
MSKTIVLYYSATGTTKQVAQTLAKQLGADLAEIHPVKPYTSTDLNWHDESTRATVEQKQEHDGRVPIKDDLPDLTPYDNVIIGHPIWWGIPRLIAATVDKLDLNGKVLPPWHVRQQRLRPCPGQHCTDSQENDYQLDLQSRC